MKPVYIKYYPVADSGDIRWKVDIVLGALGITGWYMESSRQGARVTANKWAEELQAAFKDEYEIFVEDTTK